MKKLTAHVQKNFKTVVKASSGFSYGPQRPNATSWQAQKWGWSSNQLGGCAYCQLGGCAYPAPWQLPLFLAYLA